jgi:hypothetical protein
VLPKVVEHPEVQITIQKNNNKNKTLIPIAKKTKQKKKEQI